MEDARSAIGESAQLAVLKDAGHKTYVDRNQAFIDVVSQYLKQLD